VRRLEARSALLLSPLSPPCRPRTANAAGGAACRLLRLLLEPGICGSPLFRRTTHGAFVVGLTEATLVDAHVNLSTKITPEILRFIAAAQQTISPGGHLMSLP
jgi:hypothetical protein